MTEPVRDEDRAINIFKNGKPTKYVKYGQFLIRKVDKKENITTRIRGKVETTNTAKAGQYIVKGVHGEIYVLTEDQVNKRYKYLRDYDDKSKIYEAVGEVYAVKYTGPPFLFKAPWGENMLCESGDYIASPKLHSYDDVYRIERTAFTKTYKAA